MDQEIENEQKKLEDLRSFIKKLLTDVNNITNSSVQMLNHVRQELEKMQRVCAVALLCYTVHAIHLLQVISSIRTKEVGSSEREHRRVQLMRQLLESERCRDVIRIGPQSFFELCTKLRRTGEVKDTTRSIVEEQVARFLHIIGHNVKHRTVGFFFHRSMETVSRHFHDVLRAILSLEEFVNQPSGEELPPQIQNNSRFYPFFKDCIGAIDGTHIRVKVPRAQATRYRGRKEYPSQNVFAAYDFHMKFTYVLTGWKWWEGTASDSRILKDALTREEALQIPEGKFYLGDVGFMLKRVVLTPYRGVRYHLKEYLTRGPQNYKELFNHRHASLLNVIERTFRVLKKRFMIIGSGGERHYSFEIMADIVLACCILHNFLMGVEKDDSLIAEVDQELMQHDVERSQTQTQQRDEDYRQEALLPDNIAMEMWNAYQT